MTNHFRVISALTNQAIMVTIYWCHGGDFLNFSTNGFRVFSRFDSDTTSKL